MSSRRSKRSSKATKPCGRTDRKKAKRVMAALEAMLNNTTNIRHPILEQLKQCPQAFKVGEILGKAFDSLRYAQDEETHAERYLPPSGAVIPPLV